MEPLLFVAFVYLFAGLAFARTIRRWWRRRRRDQWLWRWSSELYGRPISEAIAQLGPARDTCVGSDQMLCEWRSPPVVPAADGMLVISVRADAEGKVVSASWRVWGLSG